MNFKLLVKLAAKILGRDYSEDDPRADMYLPIWLLAFALVLLVGGAAVGVYALIAGNLAIGIGAVCALALGELALMCWKNQTIEMVPGDAFEYTTFLGNKKLYRFRDIKRLKINGDSATLFVGDGKVHIESCAILSDRLKNRIGQALKEASRQG